MDRPLLLLDVDGVLNPFSPIDEEYVFHRELCINSSTKNTGRILQLAEEYDVCWATGWEDRANKLICPLLNLPPFPVVKIGFDLTFYMRPEANKLLPHWKGKGIESFVQDRSFAFVDDEITSHCIDWAERRSETVPTLMLPINPDWGLGDAHIDQLVNWAQGLQKPEPLGYNR